MGRVTRVRAKVLGPGGQAGGGPRRPSASSRRNRTAGPAVHGRLSWDYRARAFGKARTERGRWRLDAAGRSWAEDTAPLARSSQVTDPADPRPAPPRIQGAGPPLARAAIAARSLGRRCWTRAPSSSPRRRHGPPRPPRPAPGARTRAGADRKCRCHSSGPGVRGPGSRTQGLPGRYPRLTLPSPRGRFGQSRRASRPRRGTYRAHPRTAKGGLRAGEPEGPCPEMLGLAGDISVGQGPGRPASPGGREDNGAHSGARGPPPSLPPPGTPAPARRRSLLAAACLRGSFPRPPGGWRSKGTRVRGGGQGPGAVWYPVRFAALLRSPGTRGPRHAWNPCVDPPIRGPPQGGWRSGAGREL